MSTTLPPAPPVDRPGPSVRARTPLTGTRRLALILGVLVAVPLIGATSVNLISLLARQSETGTATLPAAGGRLLVDVNGGSVHVSVGAENDVVRVTRRLEWSFVKPRFSETAGPGGVALRARCPSTWECATTYTVVVPRTFAVDLRSSAGGLAVRDVTGAVRLRSSGGSVTVTDVSGTLDLHSSAGSVRGTGLRSTDVVANSSGGRVALGFTTAPREVSARSSAGGVTVTVPPGSGPYRVAADSSAGSTQVRVRTDPAAPAQITAHSSGGRVRVEEG